MEGKNMEGKSVCSKTQIFSYLALSLGIIGLIVAGYLTRASTDTHALIIIACAIFSVVLFATFLIGIYRGLK